MKNVLAKCKTLNFEILYYSKIPKKPCQIVSGNGRGRGKGERGGGGAGRGMGVTVFVAEVKSL